MDEKTIDWGRPIEFVGGDSSSPKYLGTRQGRHVVSLIQDGAVWATTFDDFGASRGGERVRNVPRRRVGWVNVYASRKGGGFCFGTVWSSRDEAVSRPTDTTIAIIKIEFEEGEGL